jgi:broad specificity phosphatase PhoE
MLLYIIRHAEPAYPEDALTERGHDQARSLARWLANAGLDRIYSSPLRRAQETARHTAERLGLALAVEPWTRELESWWIGGPDGEELPVWQVDGGTIRGLAPRLRLDDWYRFAPFDAPALYRDFASLTAAADAFAARHGHQREGATYRVTGGEQLRVAVFCHAGFALTWLAHLLAIPPPLVWAGFSLPPASVSTVVFEPLPGGRAVPRCRTFGNVAHLEPLGTGPKQRPTSLRAGNGGPGAPDPEDRDSTG